MPDRIESCILFQDIKALTVPVASEQPATTIDSFYTHIESMTVEVHQKSDKHSAKTRTDFEVFVTAMTVLHTTWCLRRFQLLRFAEKVPNVYILQKMYAFTHVLRDSRCLRLATLILASSPHWNMYRPIRGRTFDPLAPKA